MRVETSLTESEVEILRRGIDDPDVVTDYFFRQPGDKHGWLFDNNFVEEGKWQKTVHQAAQKDIVVIGGFGTGKTSGIAMSALVWGLLTKDFKFLNVAQKVYQAKQMYDFMLSIARNTRFEDLIWEKPRRPFPKIVIRFRIGKAVYESTFEFMSVDKDSTGILSWEGDWINVEEAGLLDNLDENVINLGSRIRGSIRGRERLARLSMISNSWDNFWLWYYFDRADADPENFLSIVVSTRHNKNIVPEQLRNMLARIPVDEQARFIDGMRPEGRGNYFARDAIYKCEDEMEGMLIEDKVMNQQPNYHLQRLHGAGVVYMAVPPDRNKLYIEVGDPGTDGAPKRNAPVLMIWDVSDFPRHPARLVLFWWGNGDGKIGPFVDKMLDFADIYRPFKIFIDSTGPQKNSAQLINEHVFRNRFAAANTDSEADFEAFVEDGFDTPAGFVRGITGMDFSGYKKVEYLLALKLFIEGRLLVWAKNITGIRSQLSNYDIENDKKIAQDIVAAMAMSAYAIRGYFNVNIQDLVTHETPMAHREVIPIRRYTDTARSRRSKKTH